MTKSPATRTRRPNRRRNEANAEGLPKLLSPAQVAEATGLSEKTISRRIKDGTLKATRLGPRVLRIDRDSLLEWLGAA